MSRRKITGAALFFTLFGALASMPPLVKLFQLDVLIFGIPIEAVYVFLLWIFLIIGAVVFSRVLPDDNPSTTARQDRTS
jgi:hypothetical protein